MSEHLDRLGRFYRFSLAHLSFEDLLKAYAYAVGKYGDNDSHTMIVIGEVRLRLEEQFKTAYKRGRDRGYTEGHDDGYDYAYSDLQDEYEEM